MREALRDLLLAHNEVDADVARATAVLDTAARRAGLGIRFLEGSARAEPSAPGVRGALGRVLAEVAAGMADGTWERMKACRADDCIFQAPGESRSVAQRQRPGCHPHAPGV